MPNNLTGPDAIRNELAANKPLSDLINRLELLDVDAWFSDSERRAQLVTWLVEEAACPKPIAQLGVKTLAPLLSKAVQKSAAWAIDTAISKAMNRVLCHRKIDAFVTALEHFAGKLDSEMAARDALEAKIFAISPDVEDLRFQLSTDLLGQMATLDGLADLKSEIEKLTNKQPDLDIRIADNNVQSRFIYRSRFTQFVGRDDELQILDHFLGSDKSFAWGLITGIGGMGKSRLAFEFKS